MERVVKIRIQKNNHTNLQLRFCKKKVFNINKDESQVGSFTEYFRKKFNHNRSKIPVYSSCSNFKIKNFKKENKTIDILGKDSDFNYLINNKGNIINFEVNFALHL